MLEDMIDTLETITILLMEFLFFIGICSLISFIILEVANYVL